MATLFSDNSYTPLANPFTSEVDGAYQFYTRDGRYDIVVTKTNYTFDNDDTADVLIQDTMSVITPAQIIANQNDYAPTNASGATTWRINSDAIRTITGISGGIAQQRLVLLNTGSFNIILADQSGLSLAANQIITGNSRSFVLFPNNLVSLSYDLVSLRWRVLTPQPVRQIDAVGSAAAITNNNTEQTVYSVTVPGGLITRLGSTIRVVVNTSYNSTGAESPAWRLRYGGTALSTADSGTAITTSAGGNLVMTVFGDLIAVGSTSQQAIVRMVPSENGASDGNGPIGVIDPSADQTLLITWNAGTTSTGFIITREWAYTEWRP